MNIETFIEKLKALSVEYEDMRTTIKLLCPFSEHTDLSKDKRNNFAISKTTKLGKCSDCGKQADLDEIVIALEKSIAKGGTGQAVAARPRVKKVEQPIKRVTLAEWQAAIREQFPDLAFAAEVGASIIAQILIKDITNPFALVLVGPPSSGKTITVNFFQDAAGLSYPTDRFTPASFVSNAMNVSKEKLTKIDLLPRIQYTMFLWRDLSTLFSKRDDDLQECLGILTRVLDGEGYSTDTGVHGQRQYAGEYLFMMLAASTPIQPRVWNIMGNLGSRLFFLNINSREKSKEELADQLGIMAAKKKELICRTATKFLLQTLWYDHPYGIEWNTAADPIDIRLLISECAVLLARLRGVIQVWKDRSVFDEEYDFKPPLIEGPDRLNQLLYNLARGHAVICGRSMVDVSDLKVVVELTIDSCMPMRAKLFRALLDHGGHLGTADVMIALSCSRPSALAEIQKLVILGIANYVTPEEALVGGQEKSIRLKDEFAWFLNDECRAIRGLPPKKDGATASESL